VDGSVVGFGNMVAWPSVSLYEVKIPATVVCDSFSNIATLIPHESLQQGQTFTVSIWGRNAASIPMQNEATWSFTTEEVDMDGDGIPDDQDSCPAEDATGFDVDGDGCIDSISGIMGALTTLVEEGVIAEELKVSLLQKLNNAQASADKENICAAINKLEALIGEINAQTDKKISAEAAEGLVTYIRSVISYLLGHLPSGSSC